MWLLVTTVLFAATPERAVGFDEAVGLAALAPAVAAAEQAAATRRSWNRRISRLTWNPQLSLQPGWRLLPAGSREPELVVEALQPFSLLGHGAARRRAALLEAETLAADARAVAVARRLEAARAWIDAWTAARVHAAAERQAAVAAELERLVARAAEVGALTRADLADARAFHAEARLQVLAAEGERFDRGLDLARAVAQADGEPLRAAGELPAVEVPDEADWPRLLAAAEALPEVARRALAAQAERARAVEERAARGTVLGAGAALQRDAPGGLVVSALVRLTPALFDRGERERGALLAGATLREGERHEAAIEARVALRRAMHDLLHTRALVTVLDEDLVPASRAGAELRRRIFQAGEATILEVLQAERLALAAEIRLAHGRAAHAWARVKLWLLARAAGGR